MSKEEDDIEITEALRKSLNQAGELQPVAVCKQHPEVILSGTHRSNARGGLDKVVKKEIIDVEAYSQRAGIPHELAEISIRLHANVHRRVSTEETRKQVLCIAKGLEASVPKNEIASKLEELLPFSPSYILLSKTESPMLAFLIATGSHTSCPPLIVGVIIGPQQPGAVRKVMEPPSLRGPRNLLLGPIIPFVKTST
jgi:hypothetical protein